MLKLDIIVPIILILCLIALAYILSKVFSTEAQTGNDGKQTEILLDPDRYREDGDLGAPTNIEGANVSNTPSATGNAGDKLDKYFQDGSSGNVEAPENGEDDKYYDPEEVDTGGNTAAPTTTNTVITPPRTIRSGSYHVIAGSFRQMIYAEARVRELKKAGFSDAYVGKMNRGAYAVAVAGSSENNATAQQISQKVRAKGFGTFVKKGE